MLRTFFSTLLVLFFGACQPLNQINNSSYANLASSKFIGHPIAPYDVGPDQPTEPDAGCGQLGRPKFLPCRFEIADHGRNHQLLGMLHELLAVLPTGPATCYSIYTVRRMDGEKEFNAFSFLSSGVIAITTDVLDKLSDEQLFDVISHEIGHIEFFYRAPLEEVKTTFRARQLLKKNRLPLSSRRMAAALLRKQEGQMDCFGAYLRDNLDLPILHLDDHAIQELQKDRGSVTRVDASLDTHGSGEQRIANLQSQYLGAENRGWPPFDWVVAPARRP